jgi:N-acetylmuramoyl-L-alanine amidase
MDKSPHQARFEETTPSLSPEKAASPPIGLLRPGPSHGTRPGGTPGVGRIFTPFLAAALLVCQLAGAGALRISDRYSPLNRKRPVRPETRYIILHTTEGKEAGSLRKVQKYGEAHYFITFSGNVFRIIDRRRIAAHTGRSMWEGRTNLDSMSIGIEVVGIYNRDINVAQYEALGELLRQLKGIYKIRDRDILPHSMVAYGRPNRFHRSSHRGRKRCGAVFARPDVRRRLGLAEQPLHDPDVLAGRLRVGDPELQLMLYAQASASAGPVTVSADSEPPASAEKRPSAVPGNGGGNLMVIGRGRNAWSIAREAYNHPTTVYVFPNGTRFRGDEIRDWDRIPAGTKILLSEEEPEQEFEGFLEIGKDGDTVIDLAGDAVAKSTTIYFFPNGLIRTGAELAASASLRKMLDAPPRGTRLLVGYVYGGYVRARRSAYHIVRSKWNYPSTFYRLPDGRILSGDEIDETNIPFRTLIFFQN